MKKTKVYVNIPSNAEAGGVEALFQLVDSINTIGGEGIIIWDSQNGIIPKKYSHYNIKHSLPIEDSPENWVIYPEVWTDKLGTYQHMKKAIWWLSVDNNHGQFKDFSNSSITHFYQSYYALDFLLKNGAEKCLPLFEYISPKYINSGYDIKDKQNIVCYNPIKGIEITNQIIRLNPDINFRPIINMNENQIIELLKISKVYIDFGHHPGRDRIPRESAILGNCVITNKKGASNFYGDIPIETKFNTVEGIGDVIRFCFNNFESSINNYSLYRESIKNQKEQFDNQSKQYFLI